MLEDNNDMIQYGAGDFKRYHEGSMPEREMYELEKAAMEDPFLADALQGYAYAKTPVEDINELKQKLGKQKEKTKVIWLNLKPLSVIVKVAAILILFGGLGWILFNRNNSRPVNEIASVNKKEQEVNKPLQLIDSIKTTDIGANTQGGAITLPDSLQQTKQQYAQLEAPPAIRSTNASQSENVSSTDDSSPLSYANDTERIDAIASGAVKERSQQVNNSLAGKVAGIKASSMEQNKAPIKLWGRITDNKGEPVAFATVYDTKNKKGIQADKDGEFYFMANDSVTKVNVNAVGYSSLLTELRKNKDSNDFVLQQMSNSLQEVVVTSAFQTKRATRSTSSMVVKADSLKRITVSNAIPIIGWEQFNKYVIDSLKTLQQLGANASSAEVLVSFDVNKEGEPVRINIQKSLCTACDSEAFRIIKNGPSWKLNKKRKKANAVVRF